MSHGGIHIDSLVKQCIEGNQSAQMQVYDRYYKAMFNTANRIVKDAAEAEDVMQESFLKAFTKMHTFNGDVTLGAWLKRIVVNHSIHQYRKNQKDRPFSLDETMYKVEDNDVVSDDRSLVEQKAQRVIQAMNQLKDNYRISLTLHLIEGYDYEEVSQIMDISYANCRTTISRAKESLRNKLLNASI